MAKLKLIAAIAFLVVLTPVVIYAVLTGNGAVNVLAPKGSGLKVQVDGKEVASLKAGEHTRLNVEQGKHVVKLEAGSSSAVHEIEVKNGAYEELLPLPGQCFVLFDVTNFVNEKEKLAHHLMAEVTVKARFPEGKRFDMPAGAHYSIAEVPLEGDRKHVEILSERPCAELALDDAALIKAAAFAKPATKE